LPFGCFFWIEIEAQIDPKWISVVPLGTLFILLLNYSIAGGHYWHRNNFGEASAYDFTVVFLFFNVLTLSATTLYTSGVRNRRVYKMAMVLFVSSMIFLCLATTTTLSAKVLTFTFMG
jgi:hypothetical protein